jgi:cathepsin L
MLFSKLIHTFGIFSVVVSVCVGEQYGVASVFNNFIRKYNKQYSTDEYDTRFGIFKKNWELIHEHNNKNHSWKMGINRWMDLSWEEFSSSRLGIYDRPKSRNNALFVMPDNVPSISSLDWRTKGVVNPVKDQGQCGSCWAFSAVGAIESAYAIKTGKLYDLAEQQLVDCSSSFGNAGCNGGLMDDAFQYAMQKSLCETKNYPYHASDETCHLCNGRVSVSGYVDVPPYNETALLFALLKQPVSIAIEADQMGFQFYSSGVFDGECGTRLDHGVLLVGYGTEDGKDYWLIRNSWGPFWGDHGYIKISRGKNQCGIAMDASYPVVNVSDVY